MEELEYLDKKALEDQYIASYSYTTTQRIMGCAIALIVLSIVTILGCLLITNVIGLLTK